MSVHDHHNDPNDPVNQPRKRSRSTMDPVDRPLDPVDRMPVRNQGMGAGVWMLALLALVIIGGIIYSMSGPTTTATGPSPAGTSATPGTTGSSTTAPRTTGTGTQTTPPASPAPAR